MSNKEVPPIYGVCDSPQQFADYYPKWSGKVWFTYVKREDQPSGRDGWRWRKWGQYIGNYDIHNIEYIVEADGSEKYIPKIDIQWLFYLDSPTEDNDDYYPEFKVKNVLGLPSLTLYTIDCGTVHTNNLKLNDFTSALNLIIKKGKY